VGAAVATLLTEILRTVVALRFATGFGLGLPHPRRLMRVLIAGLAMGGVVFGLARYAVWLSIPAGMVTYAGVLILIGGFRRRPDGSFELAG
jgi:hypothetical protein